MINITLQQKQELLTLLSKMGHGSLWKIHAVKNWLNDIGIQADVSSDETSLMIFEKTINVTEPEWGTAGINALTIAYAIASAENIVHKCDYTGSGFIFRDLLDTIAINWCLDIRFS